MDRETARRIESLEREVRTLRQNLAQRIVKPPKGAASTPSIYHLTIIGGNTLSDGSTTGIVWKSPAPTTVPSLYNPDVDTTFVDGIGRAQLFINGALQTGNVLVANYNGNGSPNQLALAGGNIVMAYPATITLPLVSDATQTVTLYVPAAP